MSLTSCLKISESLIIPEVMAFNEKERMKKDLTDLEESSVMNAKDMATSRQNVLLF